ncbi:perforin-1-like [Girardinichthys multiradiatus]|uniref:perforin-1-like n=1 Tax=Girardinichthys multiradiatus TaxID=208333 RepID=UPI001FAB496D|nr:perforin-1-like [Girardinichthys multiradiatus]
MQSYLTSGFLLLSLVLQIGTQCDAAAFAPGDDLVETLQGVEMVDSDLSTRQNRRGSLSVVIVRALGLNGDGLMKTNSVARMWYSSFYYQTNEIKSDNPTWNAVYNLGVVETHLPLKVEVWDKDVGKDDLLISCIKYLTQGIHTFTCSGNGQVEVNYSLICEPGLTGSQCEVGK